MAEELEIKQDFLRHHILDKNYDPDSFLLFLQSKKGENAADLNIWTFNELKQAVGEYIEKNPKEESTYVPMVMTGMQPISTNPYDIPLPMVNESVPPMYATPEEYVHSVISAMCLKKKIQSSLPVLNQRSHL